MSRTHHHGGWKPWVRRPTGIHWTSMTPGWWTRLYMNRPKRRRDSQMLHSIRTDQIDPDSVAWGLGNHKPHEYYW